MLYYFIFDDISNFNYNYTVLLIVMKQDFIGMYTVIINFNHMYAVSLIKAV